MIIFTVFIAMMIFFGVYIKGNCNNKLIVGVNAEFIISFKYEYSEYDI